MYVDSCGGNTQLKPPVSKLRLVSPGESMSALTLCLTLVSRSIPLSSGVKRPFSSTPIQDASSASFKNLCSNRSWKQSILTPPEKKRKKTKKKMMKEGPSSSSLGTCQGQQFFYTLTHQTLFQNPAFSDAVCTWPPIHRVRCGSRQPS